MVKPQVTQNTLLASRLTGDVRLGIGVVASLLKTFAFY